MGEPVDVYYFTDAVGYGGAEKSLLNLIAGLDRSRWRPTLVYHEDVGIARLIAGASRLDCALWAVPRMPEGMEGARQALPLALALRRRQPAVFHAHLTWSRACKFGLMAALLARVPAVVATEHAFVDLPVTRSSRLQMHLMAKGTGRYIAVSAHIRRCLMETFDRPAERIVVIPNGVEVESYATGVDPELRARFSDGERRRVVLALSRLDPRKGLGVLLRAMAELPDMRLVVAGEGFERDQLGLLAHQLDIEDRVDLLGYREDVPRLLACCDVFVQPSLNEAFGLGALEAMCASRPVIASDVGGTPELVTHGVTGTLVPAGDSAALAAAIRHVLADQGPTATMVQAARRLADSYSLQHMTDAVTDLYEELLSTHAGGTPSG
ncbi:MAG TPA: glycosyltransferase [Solirubrobacteraceae bacterium]|nr:glycosyltransferase [Solirubrobacteraceae bacterium]